MQEKAAAQSVIKFTIRITERLYSEIKERALLEGCNPSELVRGAVKDYLTRDLKIQSQVLGAVESLRSDIKYVDKKTELFSSLWMYWLQYYFTFTKGFGDLPADQRKVLIEAGKRRQKTMIDSYKKDMKAQPALIEVLLADYLGQEVRE